MLLRFPTLLRTVLIRARPASQCEICRTWSAERVCADCAARLARPVLRCMRCAMRLGASGPVCGACLRNPPPVTRTVCGVDYAFPWDRLIADFKFRGRVELATPLARQLTDALRAAGAAPDVDLVLPVPLAPPRLAERGYNQAWELARRIAREFALPADASCLQRPLDTAHQADLARTQRATNLRGAFMVEPRHHRLLAQRRVALVDDVVTTGTTAREATKALLHAGAASVELWAVARTP